MVIKIFDIYHAANRYNFILAYYFEEVFIVKPITSRSADYEKYLCKKFKGITSEDLKVT